MKETLKTLRIQNRYSQDLLAKILGVSRLSYIKYESGEVEPPVSIIRKLSKIYKVSYKTLIDNEFCTDKEPYSYDYSEQKNYSIATPVPDYEASSSTALYQSTESFSQFSIMLKELQNTIIKMQAQINSMQNTTIQNISFQKSNTFNKDDFFSQIGKVQIDTSFIDEIRGASLI
ncbi:MAG: helix-turn-helix transcriptional regulator [Treponema sp.]|nr:helix-turn-helix transcriptional regulator [Candidatus Treponema scatequi]